MLRSHKDYIFSIVTVSPFLFVFVFFDRSVTWGKHKTNQGWKQYFSLHQNPAQCTNNHLTIQSSLYVTGKFFANKLFSHLKITMTLYHNQYNWPTHKIFLNKYPNSPQIFISMFHHKTLANSQFFFCFQNYQHFS